MQPYERFAAWELCHSLAIRVHKVTRAFPREELYGVTAQARKAAFSSAANIVEGSAKRGNGEFRRFLDIAIGSLAELGYWLRVARDLEFLDDASWSALMRLHTDASRTTWGLYRAVTKRGSTNRLSA